jgi:hypothetical protein
MPQIITEIEISAIIKDNCGITKMEIWNKLPTPKTISYTNFTYILGDLVESNRVAIDSEGKYCWIYNPELVAKYRNRPDLEVTFKYLLFQLIFIR